MIKFLKNRFAKNIRFCECSVEFESGKKEILKREKSKTQDSEKEGVFVFELKEYTAKILFNCNQSQAVETRAVFVPKTEVKDKIRAVSGIRIFVKQNRNAIFWKRKGTDTGFCSRKKMAKTGISEDFVALFDKDNSKDAVVLTAKIGAKFYSFVEYIQTRKGTFFTATTLIPKSYVGTVESEPWTIRYGDDAVSLLEKNVTENTNDSFARPIGWSTWDYYFTDANEDDVKENVNFICKDSALKEKIRYIALDDGWQQREGDWRSGIRYPSGLKSLVSYIKSKGFEAGIWLAPTRLHYLSATVMRRNDFLIRDGYGDPIMDEDMYVLDPTHPDGEKFLRETFAYLKDCGFTFVKLDFVSNLLKCESFFDKNAGPYDALKKLFGIARECLGQKCHVMGCSLPYLIGNGVADSRRSGLDIHNTYKHLKKCLEIATYQLPSNEKVYRLDLDYLVVRGKDTSEEDKTNVLNPNKGKYIHNPSTEFRWRDGEDFTYTEAKCWCAVMLMSGSSIFLGDRLTKLNEKGLNLIKKVLENADFHTARPIIGKDEGLPEIWKKGNWTYVFNFGEKIKKYSIEMEDGNYVDLFEEKKYRAEKGELKLRINAHDCVCLKQEK